MTLIDHVKKIVADEARGTVTNPRPLYAAAGAVDIAVDFVRGVPDRMEKVADQLREEWTPDRFGDAFNDLVQNGPADVRARGEELRDKVSATLRDRRDAVVDDLADLSADARDLPSQVRARARQAPGRAVAEIANQVGAAYELYDTFVDRGKLAVAKLRGDTVPGHTPSPANRAETGEPITPVTRPRGPATTAATPPVSSVSPGVSPSSVAPGSIPPAAADVPPVAPRARRTAAGTPAPSAATAVSPTVVRKTAARKSAPGSATPRRRPASPATGATVDPTTDPTADPTPDSTGVTDGSAL